VDGLRTITVLHLDDNIYDLERVAKALTAPGEGPRFAVHGAKSAAELRSVVGAGLAPDLFLFDIHLDAGESGEGATLVGEMRASFPGSAIVMRSNDDSPRTIARCLGGEADDFISKRTDNDELKLRLAKALELVRIKRPSSTPSSGKDVASKTAVGRTMAALSGRLPRIIDSAISAVHVTGETGTGKEVVADLFEAALPKGTPFVRVNCGAIAPTLLEAELFGHVKGAFTGAAESRIGLLEQANGGFVFLDEVAMLSTSAQVALLRAIENHEILRVGDRAPRRLKIRVLSATNADLAAEVRAGRFREDLWQRLKEAVIVLPSLRERPDEIPELVRHFCRVMDGGPYEITEPALTVLAACEWRAGNVRQLRNCLRAMTEYHVDRSLTPLAIPPEIWAELDAGAGAAEGETAETPVVLARGVHRLTLDWQAEAPPSFDELADRLLAKLVTITLERGSHLSLRALARAVGMARTTFAVRMRALVDKGMISREHGARFTDEE
jgi:DNA-binding NtrC family response regulator